MAGQEGRKPHAVVGPWRIDLDAGSVTADGGPSGLIPRAEQLLVLLCRHANVVVSREQMLEAVWAGRVVEDAAISNCVWQIRKGLGERGKDILQTRAKRGYLLALPEEAWCLAPAPVPWTPPAHAGEAAPADSGLSVDAPAAGVGRTSQPRAMTAKWVDLVVLLAVFAAVVWFFRVPPAAPLALTPDDELTVYISAPQGAPWLQDAILRATVQSVSLRRGSVLLFERPQRRNPFAGPHLQVVVASRGEHHVEAEFSFNHAGQLRRERFRGAIDRLLPAFQAFIDRTLQPASMRPSEASDVLVSARVAELRDDTLTALAQYRRAVALNSADADAKLGMAELLFALGRSREALALVDTMIANPRLTADERCALDVVLVKTAADRIRGPICPRAASLSKIHRMEMNDAIRQIEASRDRAKSASLWATERVVAIFALIRLQEWQRAESEIEAAQRIAGDAGWEHARVEIGALRASILVRKGRSEEAIRQRLDSAEAMEALGDRLTAGYFRAYAYGMMPIAPGPSIVALRRQLQRAIDQARERGDLGNEIDLLLTLVRIDRDDPDVWSGHIARLRGLIEQAYAPPMRASATQELLDEIRTQRKYDAVLQGVSELQDAAETSTGLRLWNQRLKAQAYFAQDRIDEAVAVVDAMQKEKFDIAESGAMCQFAWLFAEASQAERARELLQLCFSRDFDRVQQATRGDYGLLAKARLFELGGERARAWPVLRPRIEALIATRQPSREEAESLAMLARFATAMPGADTALLQRALRITSETAALDGAGPGLRFGVHVLRWRLCRREGRGDCGPVLPEWAPEDRFEARLARASVPGELAATRR